jgi:hypothetical protein
VFFFIVSYFRIRNASSFDINLVFAAADPVAAVAEAAVAAVLLLLQLNLFLLILLLLFLLFVLFCYLYFAGLGWFCCFDFAVVLVYPVHSQVVFGYQKHSDYA